MRILILIALCLAVATATTANKNRFNRLLHQLQREQQMEQGYESQGLFNDDTYDSDEQDDDENCYQHQCQRNQRFGTEQDDDQDQDQDEYDQSQNRGQRRGQQQHKRQQQQQHNCGPKFNLLQTLEDANSQLASKLYQQAKQENDDKNTVVSPAAIQLALAAIKRGARGNTQRQIQRVLGAGLSTQQTQQAHAALQQSLQGQDPIQQQTGQGQKAQVKITNTLILNQRTHAQQKFVQAVKACYNAQLKKCNFQNQPQQCRQQLNRYIAQKTNQQLQQAVPQDAITSNTKLVAVSTAQLKAKWGRQFTQQQSSKQGKFYPLGGQQPKNVQIIQSQGQFNYYEDEQLQVVGVPTQQQELTLYLIVPKDKDGLTQVEKQQIQNGQQLKQLLDQADQQQQDVDVELPKVQIKHKIDAKQALRKEGVQDAFDADQADLSGINGQQQGQRRRRQQDQDDEDQDYQDQDDQQQRQQQLHVNKLIHQATIKIDQQGISAANPRRQNQQQDQYDQDQDQDQDEDEDEQEQRYRQQQELGEELFGQRQRGGQSQRGQRRHRRQGQYQGEKKVKANHAFAFAIKHNASNQIVMVGRVVDAAQKSNQQGRQQRGQQGQSLNGVDQE